VITDMNIISRAMLWISVPWCSLLMAGHVPWSEVDSRPCVDYILL